MSTRDYRTKDEIIITLKGRSRAEVETNKQKKKKGPIPPSKQKKRFLHRRSKAGFITFFDLAQTRVAGNWTTNDFSIVPGLTFPPTGGGPFGSVDADPLTLANRQSLETLLLTPAPATYPTVYRKVPKTVGPAFPIYVQNDDFTISSLDNLAYWTADGLKLTDAQLHGPRLAIRNHPGGDRPYLFNYLELNDRAFTKVTAEPSAAASSVPFTIQNGAQIFLVPLLNYHFGSSVDDDEAFPITWRNVFFNLIYRVRPRDFDDPTAVFEYINPGGPFDAGLFGEALTRSAGLSPTRTVTLTEYGNGDPRSLTAGGGFPTGDVGNENLNTILFESASLKTDQLTGIVRQNGATFYFWQLFDA